MIGTTLAHCRILARAGAGGMGEIWRAEDMRLGREVAVKVLPAALPVALQIAELERLAPRKGRR